jgi:hypothetical protein
MNARISLLAVGLAGVFMSDGGQAGELVEKAVIILRDGKTTKIETAATDGSHLWVASADVAKVNGFEPKPKGLCAADLCIPVPDSDDWHRRFKGTEYFDVTRFAAKVDQAVAPSESKTTWSFGAVPRLNRRGLSSGMAPDFSLPDRAGKPVRLSSFRGKKVLLLTWSSW